MTRVFDRVLVANRGEIAVRVIEGCKAQGFTTVAVFSDADRDLPHVHAADLAVHIGPAPAAESYLVIDRIIDAAKRTGAQAIHPGYGFLSENAEFADACEAAGIVFIGPSADSIRQMGSKARARELMAARGVPVVPGYGGADQSDARLIAAAEGIGFPVLVKAAAGGGGKGMSIVRDAEALPEAIATARRLARSAFGDDTLVVERYLDQPRHVEVQILGDGAGNVVHFFERECSIQRRFQKIIEEAPSPALDEATRQALCAAGVEAGKAINYKNAGTVEFILDAEGRFYFLEVNTRLQVEHRVTERITREDLVKWQLHIAGGGALPAQSAIERFGHAIECRLYAEDPANDFLPSAGPLAVFDFGAGHDRGASAIDVGYRAGDDVSVHYDPLIAKLIAEGNDREAAIARMRAMLDALAISGLETNRAFLADIIEHPAFRAGAVDTHFIADHFAGWAPTPTEPPAACLIAATLSAVQPSPLLPGLRSGFRNNRGAWQHREWGAGGGVFQVAYRDDGGGRFAVRIGGRTSVVESFSPRPSGRGSGAQAGAEDAVAFVLDGIRRTVSLTPASGSSALLARTLDACVVLAPLPRFAEVETDEAAGGLIAPMPGKVVSVSVAVGDHVTKGQTLVILEAMKMEQRLTAPHDGVVEAVRCAAGELVDAGVALVVLAEPA